MSELAKNSDQMVEDQSKLQQYFETLDVLLNKSYLNELNEYNVTEMGKDFELGTKYLRILHITKITYDKNEDNLDKLLNIYTAINSCQTTFFLILQSSGKSTDVYLGIKNNNLKKINTDYEVLKKSLEGNFPGVNSNNLYSEDIDQISSSIFSEDNKSITSVSCIPSLKNDDTEKYAQGLEKFIDTMKNQKYTAIILAEPFSKQDIKFVKKGFEELYTNLMPFSETQLQFGENESDSVSNAITENFTKSLTRGETLSESEGITQSETSGKSKTKNYSQIASSTGGAAIGATVGSVVPGIGTLAGAGAGYFAGSIVGTLIGSSTKTQSTTVSTQSTSSKSAQKSESKSYSEGTTKTDQKTKGTSKNLQIKFENKTIKGLLDQIDSTVERIEESENYGLWSFSGYFVADTTATSKVAANTYASIIRGENSTAENTFINLWDKETVGEKNYDNFTKYLSNFVQPRIDLKLNENIYLPPVTPSTMISSKELCVAAGLPKKSVTGLNITETAEFGRNVLQTKNKSFNFGKLYHIGNEEDVDVSLDTELLTQHTLITGSTGSGKSNAIYLLIDKIVQQGKNFLIIEPVKGEYKNVFGGRKDVEVFGTNPNLSELLRINPFVFPDEIHVLEHIDRLVEIFNAAWPMYAAMPVILKDAIEKAYIRNGWDLEYSLCTKNPKEYPKVHDVMETLPFVISSSDYADENKSNYKGALITRVKSLTNGLIGRIFGGDEIDNCVLFDKNTILDFSRVGSSETKALLMGIVFLKLQEYRQSKSEGNNAPLKHVTVMEEAHHLLRKTSIDQNQEGANLKGKSVEMITNAIAEMRTYGEGFIIADQSPSLLDPAVIRNTNTKILLNLSEKEDMESVGLSVNLNEDQISEFSKLETGVAVTYQKGWYDPILTKIHKFHEIKGQPYDYNHVNIKEQYENEKTMKSLALKVLLNYRLSEKYRFTFNSNKLKDLKEWLHCCYLSNISKKYIENMTDIEGYQPEEYEFKFISSAIAEIIDPELILFVQHNLDNFEEWTNLCLENLRNLIDTCNNIEFEYSILHALLREQIRINSKYENYYFHWVEFARNKLGREI